MQSSLGRHSSHQIYLTLLHSERPKLYTILAFLSAIGLKADYACFYILHMSKGLCGVV